MKATVDIEVVPIWFIEKWCKENAEQNSALDFFIKQMIKEWKCEELKGETDE